MNHKITIVIPTYKRPVLLARALNSVISDYYKFDIWFRLTEKMNFMMNTKKFKKNLKI